MAAFVAEGRISASSLVSPWSSGPFTAAAATPEFAPLVRAVTARPEPEPARSPPPVPQTSITQIPTPQARAVEAEQLSVQLSRDDEMVREPAPTPSTGAAARPLLVWAALASITPAAFEAALGAYGPCVAIRSGLWLVQARLGPAPLRNALSRRLRDGDALLVVEAPLERTAWFNLDQVSEQDLRRLWIV